MSVQLYAKNGKSKPTKKGKKGTKKNPRAASKAHKSSRMHKGFLDTAESVAGLLPGAIRGIRSTFGNFKQSAHREAVFATPASFAMVQNNVTEMSAEGPVTHPTLGLTGTRLSFSQPLATILASSVPPGQFFNPASGPATLGPDNYSIFLAPYILQGPIAYRAATFEKYVFRRVRVKYITYQTTAFLGCAALGIEVDPARPVSSDFQTLRMVTPSVTFPYRIPEAVLEWFYDGPDVYFTAAPVGNDIAQSRQNHQAIIRGYDAFPVTRTGADVMGFLEISGDIEFYDPIPPAAITAMNLREHLAVTSVLSALRPVAAPLNPPGSSAADQAWLERLSAAAGSCPRDLKLEDRPPGRVVEDDDDDYPYTKPELARSESVQIAGQSSLLGRAFRSPFASPNPSSGSRLP